MFLHHIGIDQPARYEIQIQGRLNHDLSDWFQGPVDARYMPGETGETITVLTGTVADQSALHGLLARIRDLGLTLLYVDCLTARGSERGLDEETKE